MLHDSRPLFPQTLGLPDGQASAELGQHRINGPRMTFHLVPHGQAICPAHLAPPFPQVFQVFP